MMCKFSSRFKEQYDLAGGNVTGLPPYAASRMTLGTNQKTQVEFLQVPLTGRAPWLHSSMRSSGSSLQNTQYGIAYMDLGYALEAGLPYADMVNRANATVSPSVASISSGAIPPSHGFPPLAPRALPSTRRMQP